MRKYFVEILSFDGSDFYNKLSKIRRNKDCYDFAFDLNEFIEKSAGDKACKENKNDSKRI